jgi:two-component system LytT family response regulator
MKSTITSLVVDDESANREVLAGMLRKHCPVIHVLGEASSADNAFELASKLHPQLVFVDVKMPGKSGFEFLRMYKELPFDVIFVSGYDEYAIQAFEFNAVDYILKPVDYTQLIHAVGRAEKRVEDKIRHRDHLLHFVHSLDEKDQLVKRLRFHHHDKVHIVNVDEIVSIQALRGYSEICTADNVRLISSRNLVEYENILAPFTHFLRISKSTIINASHIDSYTKGTDCFIKMKKTGMEIEVSRRKKTDVLRYLNEL